MRNSNMSFKDKEARGKQKALPKLKTILANPAKKKSPILSEDELVQLENILQTAISNSGMEAKKFVTAKHIHLGLESGLRTINNQQSSCVFISLSIKPSHIASLVARNAEIKDETQPVYAQPRLEEFTEKLFGIRTLCMVLPKNLDDISEDLYKWVEQRRKPKRVKKEVVPIKKPKRKSSNIKRDNNPENVEESVKSPELSTGTDKDSWKGDYISFGKGSVVKRETSLQDENVALDTLSRIMDNIPKIQIKSKEVQPMEVSLHDDSSSCVKEPQDIQNSDSDDESVDFLGEYKSLVVHKIKPNPNKKPKKKRNKKNSKNKNIKK